MKPLRLEPPGQQKPALPDASGSLRDLSGHVDDIADGALSDTGLDRLRAIDLNMLPLADPSARIGPCVGHVGKFICTGLNHADDAAESGMGLPEEPVIFLKATSAITGPNNDVEIPRGSVKTDWEVEPGVVIGREAKYVSEAEALDCVAGYCVVNDPSERDFQLHRSGQWVKGKPADTFGPIGPWLVTRDEIPDPQSLGMRLEVNGHRYQDGSTRTMHFGVATIVPHLSRFMSLQQGDVFSTGTPPGVGMGQKHETCLKAGDVMDLSIEGPGAQTRNVMVAP